ncbi:MAG: flagellar hook-basal body complex protein FliE [Crenarchaeota archaeon]|nr:flagellar hook-basal body complex protein FliE [Thermoproteota archaeon]
MGIAIVGMPGSGKTTCINAALESLGIERVSLGDVVREEAKKRGVPMERLNEFANDLRRELGPAAVAILARRKIEELRGPACIIDGVRSLHEVDYFRNELGLELVIVAIHSSPRTRFERLRRRGRPDDPRTWEEFVARDRRELSWGIGSVIALADHMIVNEGGVEELRRACVEVIGSVLRALQSSSRP